MQYKNKYHLLEPTQTDPRLELTIGNRIWIKVILEALGGFGNGFVLRLVPILVGFLLGVGTLLTIGGWIPGLIIGISITAGIIFGGLYARDQYKISSKKNKEELRLIIKHRELQAQAIQTDRLLNCTSDDYLILDNSSYCNKLNKYIIARKSTEELNRELKLQVDRLERKYSNLTGNIILAFNKTLSHPAVCLKHPSITNYIAPDKQGFKQDIKWAKIKTLFAGLKQGLNYVGIPSGLLMATLTSFIMPATIAASPVAIAIFVGILAVSAVAAVAAFSYYLYYEYRQEKKMEQLKHDNKYLKAKLGVQSDELNDRLNYIHFQNEQIKKRISQLKTEIQQTEGQISKTKKVSSFTKNFYFRRPQRKRKESSVRYNAKPYLIRTKPRSNLNDSIVIFKI